MSEEKLRVFISWSGDLSRSVAGALREWLPSIFDLVDPWMSDADIGSGARGLEEIHSTLSRCSFGIIVVTEENQHSAWLNYESGAISKSISDSQTRVIPVLVDISAPSQLTGPLAQFQARKLDEEGMLLVVDSMAAELGVTTETAKERFAAFWPKLSDRVDSALNSKVVAGASKNKQRSVPDMIEEVLTQVRDLSRTVDGMSFALQGRPELIPLIHELELIARELADSRDKGSIIAHRRLVRIVERMYRDPVLVFSRYPDRLRSPVKLTKEEAAGTT